VTPIVRTVQSLHLSGKTTPLSSKHTGRRRRLYGEGREEEGSDKLIGPYEQMGEGDRQTWISSQVLRSREWGEPFPKQCRVREKERGKDADPKLRWASLHKGLIKVQ